MNRTIDSDMVDKRSALKQGQIDILELLYKYRFGSRQLIAGSLGITVGSNLYDKLNVLIKHGWVAKRQEKRLKLHGTPAAYYLTPKGLRTLQALDQHDYITDSIIKASYRDKVVSQSFVNHTLDVYRQTNLLKQQYPELKVFLRRDMSRYSYFPDNPPDAFLSLKLDDTPRRFFLDVIPDSLPRNLLDKRITGYAEFFEEGGWDVTNSDLPKLLFIAGKSTTESRTRRTVRVALSRANMKDELEAYTTTQDKVLRITADSRKIWTNTADTDESSSLPELE